MRHQALSDREHAPARQMGMKAAGSVCEIIYFSSICWPITPGSGTNRLKWKNDFWVLGVIVCLCRRAHADILFRRCGLVRDQKHTTVRQLIAADCRVMCNYTLKSYQKPKRDHKFGWIIFGRKKKKREEKTIENIVCEAIERIHCVHKIMGNYDWKLRDDPNVHVNVFKARRE